MTEQKAIPQQQKQVIRVPRLIVQHVEPITDKWSLLDIVTKRCPPSWEEFFPQVKENVAYVDTFLQQPKQLQTGFYPVRPDVFRAFNVTPLTKTKVIIWAQDSYIDESELGGCRATGLCLSVDTHDSTPPSMRTIMKELENTYPGININGGGSLMNWAMQGVLLLNAALTVAPGESGSHLKAGVWDGFMIKLLRFLAEKRPGCVYVLVGSWEGKAKDFEKKIDPKGIILTTGHPSPKNKTKPFLGCGVFKQIDEALKAKKQDVIDWSIG